MSAIQVLAAKEPCALPEGWVERESESETVDSSSEPVSGAEVSISAEEKSASEEEKSSAG